MAAALVRGAAPLSADAASLHIGGARRRGVAQPGRGSCGMCNVLSEFSEGELADFAGCGGADYVLRRCPAEAGTAVRLVVAPEGHLCSNVAAFGAPCAYRLQRNLDEPSVQQHDGPVECRSREEAWILRVCLHGGGRAVEHAGGGAASQVAVGHVFGGVWRFPLALASELPNGERAFLVAGVNFRAADVDVEAGDCLRTPCAMVQSSADLPSRTGTLPVVSPS
ncbi:protein-glutamate O-methyltransferase CheR [Babesia caballi]|uniref:Protein-glutamate O-methyltransferase CheR n=1 Tax=Babesia caballi TaxID=5871 RepID=A0AAV4LNG2_BABCB|nr:protein-glutamate O-methyltransferase CheR [Babesia caballi]